MGLSWQCLSLFQITFAFLSLGLTFGQQDCDDNACCLPGGYTEINDPRRSINSVLEAGQSAICDRALAWGWYRFTSYVGGKMPTQRVNEFRCGTIHPIWMKHPHPTDVNKTVDGKACINFYNMSNGCFTELNIKVRNCGGHYVYYLGPTYSCSLAYCAGFEEPCPYGEVGQPPNCTEPPQEFDSKYLDVPTIQYKEKEDATQNDPKAVSLLCKVKLLHGVEKWDNVTYQIEWFSAGKRLQSPTIRCQVPPDKRKHDDACPDAKLLVSVLVPGETYKAGMWVSCNVSAKFTNSLLNSWTIPKYVNEMFYAGIKVYPGTIRLRSCNELLDGDKITIQPTIPVRPESRFGPPKPITVKVWMPEGLERGPCRELKLEGLKSIEVEVKPKCPYPVNDPKTRIISIQLEGGGPFWSNTRRTIWVAVLPSEPERCKTYTDPHYYGLDKLSITRRFDFMGHGDFVLYKNPEKKFEVQTRQWACGHASITCNCAAVLRDHNDVIEFNVCNKNLELQNSHPTPLQVKIRSKKCLRPGISLKKKINGDNIEFSVMFPTGVKVELVRNYWGIDVNILTTRAQTPFQESGICLYDRHKDGNNITAFGENHRIQPMESFFDILPPRVNDVKANYAFVCTCIDGKDVCGENALNVPTFFLDKKTALNLCDSLNKREIRYSDELTDDDYDLFRRPFPTKIHHRFKKALPSPVVSKENASYYCTQKIAETKVGRLCAKAGVDVQALVDSCTVDISLTGDFSFAIGIASMLMGECGYVAAINSSLPKNESSDGGQGEASIGNEIAELLCPNDCAFNGDCVNGSCVCYKDYTAEDCSISIYQMPSISRLQGDGLCDKRIRPCKKVTVMGTGWLNSTNITCHVVEFKVVNSSWTPNKTEQSFPGIMTDLVLVDCYLPDLPVKQGYYDENIGGTPAAGLKISVSNDGIHKSDETLTFISYDSACMSCNVSTGCFYKNNSCRINRYCFAPNEVHPNDLCYQCLPDVNKNSWTKRQVNHPPNVTSGKAYYALYKENLELVFDAVDPEGMPVTISLEDGNPEGAVIKGNTFHWNVTTNKTTTFYLKATDSCLASSTFNFTVSLVGCQCENNGSCAPVEPRGSGYYLCNCPLGFTGQFCEVNIDECLQSYPCSQGRCIDGINNYTCICDSGYEGRNCDHDVDDCASSPCVNGTCNDHINGYSCNCKSGFTGQRCDKDINECQSSPCFHGKCFDRVDNYYCHCEDGYTGRDCDVNINECQSYPCVNGTCIDKVNGFDCFCQAGFTGIRCEIDINDCLLVSCGNGTCVDHVNNYSCICNVGFTGRHCEVLITHCSNDSCYPDVACTEREHTISCGSCPSGFTGDGKNCKDIDDCVNHTCSYGGSCVDGVNSYSCNCLAGFTGDHCETDINDCVNHTCSNGGSCVDGVNSYLCNCMEGFTGDHCNTNINDCVNHTCENGGSCVDGVNNYSCNCLVGFAGQQCQIDIDDCVNHTCGNGGSCIDGINNYSCNCLAGFTGDHCETDINDCVNHTCSNGGSCEDGINNYTCNCLTGFTGYYCETDINDCVNHTCSNGGSCADGVNSYSCNCLAGYTGHLCETGIPTSQSVHGETSTAQPTTEVPAKDLVIELRIQRDWNNDLDDEKSEAFKKLSLLVEQEIRKLYSQNDNFIDVKILSFKPGSVVAEFKIIFKTELEDEEALAPLKKGVEDGKIGPLNVDPESLKIVNEVEEPTKGDKTKIPYPVIIGVSCGGVFVLALLSICLIRYCQQRKMVTQRRVSDGMPSEVAFPKPEKYELQETGSKEDIVRYEEIAMWNDSARYEELGILQDSARYEKLGFSNATYQEVGISNAAGDYQEIGIPNAAGDYQEIGISSDALR